MTINAHQFNNQLDHWSITKRTNFLTEIWTRVIHDWMRALYQLSYQPLTIIQRLMFTLTNRISLNFAIHFLRLSEQILQFNVSRPNQGSFIEKIVYGQQMFAKRMKVFTQNWFWMGPVHYNLCCWSAVLVKAFFLGSVWVSICFSWFFNL